MSEVLHTLSGTVESLRNGILLDMFESFNSWLTDILVVSITIISDIVMDYLITKNEIKHLY